MPREGGLIGADMMSIPVDAPHPQNAEKWMNYLMLPEVMANITNATKYPNGNLASLPFVQDALQERSGDLSRADIRAKLHVMPEMTPEQTRLVTRLWTRFRTGE